MLHKERSQGGVERRRKEEERKGGKKEKGGKKGKGREEKIGEETNLVCPYFIKRVNNTVYVHFD